MKKIVYTACFLWLLAIFSMPLQAQTTTFGLRGGATIANLKSKFYDSSIVGFTGGFYTNIWLGKSNFTFSPELLYTRKGAKGNGLKTELGYIELPLLFKYNFIPGGTVNPAIYAGPYVGAIVRSNTTLETSNFKEQLDESPVKIPDFGLTTGGSVGFGRFSVGIRYEFGLLDIQKKDSITKLGPLSKTKNRVLSFVGGVRF